MTSITKLSYAAVVAGVKPDLVETISPSQLLSDTVQAIGAKTEEPEPGVVKPTKKPRTKQAKRGGAQKVSQTPADLNRALTRTAAKSLPQTQTYVTPFLLPTPPLPNARRRSKEFEPDLVRDAAPLGSAIDSVEVGAVEGADSGVAVRGSTLGSGEDSGPDSGSILDPEDGGYRGRVANLLVDTPDCAPIIKTRSARAAAAQNVQQSSSPPPSQHYSQDQASLSPPPSTQPRPQSPIDIPLKVRSRPPPRGKGKGRRTQPRKTGSSGLVPITPGGPSGLGDATPSYTAMTTGKRRRPVQISARMMNAFESDSDADSPTARKRLRTNREKSPVTILVPSSDGEESDNPFQDNPASSGMEDHDLHESEDEGNVSDVGSLNDFIIDDDARSDHGMETDAPLSEGEGKAPGIDGVARSRDVGLGVHTDVKGDHLNSHLPLSAKETVALQALLSVSNGEHSRLNEPKPPLYSQSAGAKQVLKEVTNIQVANSRPSGSRNVENDPPKPTDFDENTPRPPSCLVTPRRPRSFGSVIAAAPKKEAKSATLSSRPPPPLLEDLYHFRVANEPDTCEVTSEILQDPLLREFYLDCPKLRSGQFQSWSEAPGPGMIFFSRWAEICPDMDFDTCISIIQFVQSGRYINPSRLSPTQACIQLIPGARTKYHLCTADRQTAVCLSPVMSVASHVVAPPERGLKQKWLAAIFHSQEWERFVSFMCMVFGQDTLQAQLAKDAIQFTTRVDFGGRGGPAPTLHKKASMFSNIRSPSIVSKSGGAYVKTADPMTLDFETPIPVYDCRGTSINFSQGVGDLKSYSRWTREIPYGSFVVVAYTVAVFRASSTNLWTISLNLQWAMILGIDPEHEHDDE